MIIGRENRKKDTFTMGNQIISCIDVDVNACKIGYMALSKATCGDRDLVIQDHPFKKYRMVLTR